MATTNHDLEDPTRVGAIFALLSALPGPAALAMYAAGTSRVLPPLLGSMFWPLLIAGVCLAGGCVFDFRRRYRGGDRPWFVSMSIASHTLTLIFGVPLLALIGAALLIQR